MNRMRELRKKLNITMKQLGEMVGVSESTISFYETGRHEPDLKTITVIADILGTSVDYMIGHDTNECTFNAEENEIVELYKRMNDIGKKTAMNTIRALAAYSDMISADKKSDKIEEA